MFLILFEVYCNCSFKNASILFEKVLSEQVYVCVCVLKHSST